MPDIFTKSIFEIQGVDYGTPVLSSYDCREIAIGYMLNTWHGRVRKVAIDHLGELVYNYGIMRYVNQKSLEPYTPKLKIWVMFEEDEWDAVPVQLKDDVSAFIHQHYGIRMNYLKRPHMYDTGGWGDRDALYGYNISGDARVVPAFFWSVFWLRSWMENAQPQYTTFESFIKWATDHEDYDEFEGDYDDDAEQRPYYGHLEAYNALIAGEEPPAQLMLALVCGPIDAARHASDSNNRSEYMKSHPDIAEKVDNALKEFHDAINLLKR